MPEIREGRSRVAKKYAARPPLQLKPGAHYSAVVELEKGGSITVDLLPDDAPETVNSFIFLAREGYYDGCTFHRVIPGFVAQGGDPTGTGSGGPGYTLPDEVNPHRHEAGVLSMAKTAAPNSAGSQFYITLASVPHLDGAYTVFGQVREGMDVVQSISPRDPSQAATPGDSIRTITIQEA